MSHGGGALVERETFDAAVIEGLPPSAKAMQVVADWPQRKKRSCFFFVSAAELEIG